MRLQFRNWMFVGVEVLVYLVVLAVIWLDEFIDLPYLLLNAPPTPHRPQEYLLESISILVVAILTVTITLIILRRISRLERYLRVCAWCRRVWIDNQWVHFEEYALKRHSLKSSHGICDECMANLDKQRTEKTTKGPH